MLAVFLESIAPKISTVGNLCKVYIFEFELNAYLFQVIMACHRKVL